MQDTYLFYVFLHCRSRRDFASPTIRTREGGWRRCCVCDGVCMRMYVCGCIRVVIKHGELCNETHTKTMNKSPVSSRYDVSIRLDLVYAQRKWAFGGLVELRWALYTFPTTRFNITIILLRRTTVEVFIFVFILLLCIRDA